MAGELSVKTNEQQHSQRSEPHENKFRFFCAVCINSDHPDIFCQFKKLKIKRHLISHMGRSQLSAFVKRERLVNDGIFNDEQKMKGEFISSLWENPLNPLGLGLVADANHAVSSLVLF